MLVASALADDDCDQLPFHGAGAVVERVSGVQVEPLLLDAVAFNAMHRREMVHDLVPELGEEALRPLAQVVGIAVQSDTDAPGVPEGASQGQDKNAKESVALLDASTHDNLSGGGTKRNGDKALSVLAGRCPGEADTLRHTDAADLQVGKDGHLVSACECRFEVAPEIVNREWQRRKRLLRDGSCSNRTGRPVVWARESQVNGLGEIAAEMGTGSCEMARRAFR